MLDVGCGAGQLTLQLARHFNRVIGADPSQDQLDHAAPHPRVTWLQAPAESLPIADASTDLITAAQAAHWFDRAAFYAEARRIGRPGAIIALVSYGVLRLDNHALQHRFDRFYQDEIGPFWPPERKLVDSGYAGIEFSFAELPAPSLSIRRDWSLGDFAGYLATWSAIRRARDSGRDDILAGFSRDLSRFWRARSAGQRLFWPLAMRIGWIMDA